jgi:hypothetical protein
LRYRGPRLGTLVRTSDRASHPRPSHGEGLLACHGSHGSIEAPCRFPEDLLESCCARRRHRGPAAGVLRAPSGEGHRRHSQPRPGRFRTFLLADCWFFLAYARDRKNPRKRGGFVASIPPMRLRPRLGITSIPLTGQHALGRPARPGLVTSYPTPATVSAPANVTSLPAQGSSESNSI